MANPVSACCICSGVELDENGNCARCSLEALRANIKNTVDSLRLRLNAIQKYCSEVEAAIHDVSAYTDETLAALDTLLEKR